MPTDDALLFIDANQYLDLYRTVTGKRLLAPLSEQAANIFVTQQVVDEVTRRKIEVASDFLARQFIALKLQTYKVPDHLFGTTEEESKSIRGKMEEIHQKIKQVNKDLNALAMGIMEKIRQSNDEVSVVLTPLFANAVHHREDEWERAKQRKEHGRPPGKKADPVGDQLTWEQILSRFVGKKKLWIITKDSDYGTIYDGRGFLNQFLYDELRKASPDAEAFMFNDVVDGIKHFADVTGVKADTLPTPKEHQAIKDENNTLIPLDWLFSGVDDAPMEARATEMRRQRANALLGGAGGLSFSSGTPLVLRNSSSAVGAAEGIFGDDPPR
jgi:PIN domain